MIDISKRCIDKILLIVIINSQNSKDETMYHIFSVATFQEILVFNEHFCFDRLLIIGVESFDYLVKDLSLLEVIGQMRLEDGTTGFAGFGVGRM